MTTLRVGGATDVGRVRTNNEDQLLVAERLFAVADGMGGHAAGEVAALTAVESLRTAFDAEPTVDGLVEAVKLANRSVWNRAQEASDLRGMGTTLTAAALITDDDGDHVVIVNVGDSRGYLFRDGELEQVTTDDSLVEELVRTGQLRAEDAFDHPQRHILTRALGIEPEVDVDPLVIDPYRGDRILLASDGLSDEVRDDQIASVLRRLADPNEAARELVAMAKDGGGVDNITVVIVDVVDDDDKAGAASAELAKDPPKATPPPLTRAGDGDGSTTGAGPPAPPKAKDTAGRRRLTPRVIAFVVAIALLLGGAALILTLYARGSYYVGFDDDQVAIYRGRPDGFLWFDPQRRELTDLTAGELPPRARDDLEDGKVEPSLRAARRYVANLRDEAARLATTTTTTTTTTAPVAPGQPPPP